MSDGHGLGVRPLENRELVPRQLSSCMYSRSRSYGFHVFHMQIGFAAGGFGLGLKDLVLESWYSVFLYFKLGSRFGVAVERFRY